MKQKEMYKWLKREAEKLPKDTYDTEFVYKYWEEFDDDGNPLVKTIFHHPINHGRRMRRIWQRTKSIIEIEKYLRKYNHTIL